MLHFTFFIKYISYFCPLSNCLLGRRKHQYFLIKGINFPGQNFFEYQFSRVLILENRKEFEKTRKN